MNLSTDGKAMRPRLRRAWVAIALAVLACATATRPHARPACTAASGAATVPLIELYTSEGCDSCPPADRWLSARFPARTPPGGASVLAFHVDYWDRLGWKDRFASPAYSERQYAAMRASGATFVYTPQVLVQGRDAEFGRGTRALDLLAEARRGGPRASVALAAKASGPDRIDVRVTARLIDPVAGGNAVVWVAATESGLVSDVNAGENRGVRLTHDHVVRALAGPYPVPASGEMTTTAALARPVERGADPALVAVVQDARTGRILQSLTLAGCIGD
jgi:hypothetical protein